MIGLLKKMFGMQTQNQVQRENTKTTGVGEKTKEISRTEHIQNTSKDSPVRNEWINYQHQRVEPKKGIKRMEEVARKYEGQHPIDIHYVYLTLQQYYYAHREKTGMLERCKSVLQKDMDLYPVFRAAYLKKHDYFVNYPAFKQMAIILEKEGKYGEAIEVCDRAMELDVKCDTKTGFEGRKKKLEKKLINAK